MLRKGRDEESFRVFVAVASEPLGRLAFLLCGDHHLANDLVQNCLIRLYRAWPRQRATVVLRYWSQLSVAETAAALRCSVGTVKSQTARGPARSVRPRTARSGKVVALTRDDVWLFGGWIEFAQHWDGRAWRHVDAPPGVQFETTAAADGAGGVLAGTTPVPLSMLRWDGSSWTVTPGPATGTDSQEFIRDFAVAPGSTVLWAVGERFTGGGLRTPGRTGTVEELTAIVEKPNDTAFAAYTAG